MINLDTYIRFLNKISEFFHLTKGEKSSVLIELKTKKDEISNLRDFILNDVSSSEKYVCISFFFCVYALILKNLENKDEYNKFKTGNGFEKIKEIILNPKIKAEIQINLNSESEYIEKYNDIYNIIAKNGENNISKIVLGNIDIMVQMFWNIIEDI